MPERTAMPPEFRSDHWLYRQAARRANAKLGFYIHAVVFVLVMSVAIVISIVTGSGPWNLAAFAGWGIGLAMHGLYAVGGLAAAIRRFRQRLLHAELERLKRGG